jgi:ABC-type transport system involved in multi-copper enzyme maturation permease subunit
MSAALITFQARSVIRGRWSLVAILSFAAASAVVASVGLGSFRQLGLGAVGPAAVSFLNLSLLLPTAQALLLGALALSGERESGFLSALRARGLSSRVVVLAIWLSVTLSAWLSLLAGFAVVAVIVAGSVPAADIPTFIGILLVCAASAAVAAAVGVLIGSAVTNRLQASLVAIAAWFLLALGLDLLVIGLGVFLTLGEPAILGAVLANPLESARVAGLLLLDASGSALGTMGIYLDDHFGPSGSLVLLLSGLGAWVVGPLALASYVLGRRDV